MPDKPARFETPPPNLKHRNDELRAALFKASERLDMCAASLDRANEPDRANIARKWAREAKDVSNVIG